MPCTLALALLALACSQAKPTAAGQPIGESIVTKSEGRPRVAVTTAGGQHYAVKVEIAATAPERERGLMYRRDLGTNDGMIFLFEDEREHAFWMKNTYIPLDMIFIAGDGTIVGIVAEATPETETSRTVGKPSQYVLEVNGGWSAMKGVRTGDRVDLSEVLSSRH